MMLLKRLKFEKEISSSDEATRLLKEGKLNLKELVNENEKKITEAEKNIDKQKKKIEETKPKFTCTECGKMFASKPNVNMHVKTNHPKYISCEHCAETLSERWMF